MPWRAACCAAALLWTTAAIAGPPYQGRTLDDVLQDLGTQGLRLIYSSETVPGSLRVQREPVGHSPAETLDEVLANVEAASAGMGLLLSALLARR